MMAAIPHSAGVVLGPPSPLLPLPAHPPTLHQPGSPAPNPTVPGARRSAASVCEQSPEPVTQVLAQRGEALPSH